MSHTPGPWIVIRAERAGRAYFSIDAADGYHEVAMMPLGDSIASHEANARLVAAAPVLLAAAKNVLVTLQNEYNERALRMNFPDLLAAIAKAESPTPTHQAPK